MKLVLQLIKWTVGLAVMVLAAGCSDDDTSASPADGYGYVQFRLYKNKTRANELDYLREVAKIRVTLRSEDDYLISQTVNVAPANETTPESGLQSDKILLAAGKYFVQDYELFNAVDKLILTGEPTESTIAEVVAGGLVVKDLAIAVVKRGTVRFRLVKDLSGVVPKTRATPEYMFREIVRTDLVVVNTLTKVKTELNGMKTSYVVAHPENGEGNPNYEYTTSYCKVDSLPVLKAGNYQVSSYVTYADKNGLRKAYEVRSFTEGNAPVFVVEDGKQASADIPVTLKKSEAAVLDGLALKKIWEALDGPNWRVKWTFDNKDVDLWTNQPGVRTDGLGRVIVLRLTATGAKGHMPAELGELSELKELTLGNHSFNPGNAFQNDAMVDPETDIEAYRNSFYDTFFGTTDLKATASDELKFSFKLSNIPVRENTHELRELPGKDSPINYATLVYSLPKEINNLKKLAYLNIAYSPMEALPEDLSGLESLTDVEIFVCPKMTEFPIAIAQLPKLISLIFSSNPNVPSESLYEGLVAMNAGPAAKYLQLLQTPNQALRVIPDLRKMERLSKLNVQSCGLEEFEVPFGKDHVFIQFAASGNKLSQLPVDDDGFFFGVYDSNIESLDFSYNEFTEMPDIFGGSKSYRIASISFAHNRITGMQHGDNFRGVRVETLSLGYNKMTQFPTPLIRNSNVIYYQLQGNGFDEIPKEAFEDNPNAASATTWDLSYNHLSEMPQTFNQMTLPYLSGLDLSWNRFAKFPFLAVNNQSLGVLIFRGQRNEKGVRCFRDWPTGIGSALARLRGFYVGSNDLRLINENLSYLIYNFEIYDNPNISVDVSNLCPYIKAGTYNLMYSPGQDIRGCDVLNLD